MQITFPGGPPLPCAVPVCARGPGGRASLPGSAGFQPAKEKTAAKMAALPGSGRASDPRRGPPDRFREAYATICITRQGRGKPDL